MTVPVHWEDSPVAWDVLQLPWGTPGLVVDVDVERGYKCDEAGGDGVHGATLTMKGRKLATVRIKFKMWTRIHLQKCSQFLDEFNAAKKTHSPVDCVHPILQEHNLKSILFVDVSGPTMPDADGLRYMTISGREFAPPPPKPKGTATNTPSTSLPPGWTKDSHGDALSPAQQEYQKQLSDWKRQEALFPWEKPAKPRPRPIPPSPDATSLAKPPGPMKP